MSIPSLVQTIRDPGLGLVETGQSLLCFMGTCSSGSVGQAYVISSPAAATDTLGFGPLVDDVCHTLLTSGGPVIAVRLNGSVVGSVGAVTKSAVGTSTGTVTAAGTPTNAFELVVHVTNTGALGVAYFRYSLDGERTYSDVMSVPTGGTYAVPHTGITLTFVPGAGPVIFERGDKYALVTVAPHYGSTDLAAGFTALTQYMSLSPGAIVEGVIACGANATGADAATLFAALDTQLGSLAAVYKYMYGAIDAGNDGVTAVKTAFASITSTRVMACYGKADAMLGNTMAGYAAPKGPIVRVIAARCARAVISEDLARVASGPMPGVLEVSHDEYLLNNMDDSRFTTLRTWPGKVGYFVTNGMIKAPVGSDYKLLQFRRVMDVACRVAADSQTNFSSAEFLTKKDGTIEDDEAARVEATVTGALNDAIILPKNASGRAGHASALRYTVDRTVNLNTTSQLVTKVAIRPLGYAKDIITELGFSVNVGG